MKKWARMKKTYNKKKSVKNHKGEWVAVSGKKVLASNNDPGKLMDIVKEKFGNIETVIMRVPEKNQILLL